MKNAVECLEAAEINDDYTRALQAYAYALYDPMGERTQEVMMELGENAITGETPP